MTTAQRPALSQLDELVCNETTAILRDAIAELAAEIRALKAEVRRLAGPFCSRCHLPLSDGDIEAYGTLCESCERALGVKHGWRD